MSYPDWVEDRFGDDIPDWAEERWGDDDDDDDFDDFDNFDNFSDSNNQSRREYVMSTKEFFTGVKLPDSRSEVKKCISRSRRFSTESAMREMENVLKQKNLIAVDPEDDEKYKVYVCENMQKLAKGFNIYLPATTECRNVMEAVDTVSRYKKRIEEDLFLEIESFFQKINDMENGHFEFLCPYENASGMNDMLEAINQQYQIHSFEELQSFCRRFAYTLDLSEIEEKIEENVQKIDKEKKNRYASEWEIKKLNKENISLSKALMSIKNSSYFSRETFAMLYIRLEDYVKKEQAIIEFVSERVHTLKVPK